MRAPVTRMAQPYQAPATPHDVVGDRAGRRADPVPAPDQRVATQRRRTAKRCRRAPTPAAPSLPSCRFPAPGARPRALAARRLADDVLRHRCSRATCCCARAALEWPMHAQRLGARPGRRAAAGCGGGVAARPTRAGLIALGGAGDGAGRLAVDAARRRVRGRADPAVAPRVCLLVHDHRRAAHVIAIVCGAAAMESASCAIAARLPARARGLPDRLAERCH